VHSSEHSSSVHRTHHRMLNLAPARPTTARVLRTSYRFCDGAHQLRR
jgi:hypothetical protein